MLEKITHPPGLIFYRSPLLHHAGVRHAFTTRIGGVSANPFESLNLGNPPTGIQDSAENLRVNHDRVQRAISCGDCNRRWLQQIHGNHVAVVDSSFSDGSDGDGLLTRDSADLLTIRVADCVPALMATEDGRAVAAVHAGWRGVIGGIVPAAARSLCQFADCRPDQILIAIGPCIGPDAFEVGGDVWPLFESKFGAACVRHAAPTDREPEKAFVDLRKAIRLQLEEMHVATDRIDVSDQCTFANHAEFFSHRRDHGLTGRLAALIAPS